MEAYDVLASAIIMQAAKDYRSAKHKLKNDPGDSIEQASVNEIERFFLSRWFEALTDVDGATILKKLRQEAEKI